MWVAELGDSRVEEKGEAEEREERPTYTAHFGREENGGVSNLVLQMIDFIGCVWSIFLCRNDVVTDGSYSAG